MVFSDLFFIYVFLPAAAICYALGRCGDHSRMRRLREYGQPRIRCECPYSNAVLIIFSLIFYAWGEPIYVALMIVSVFMNYVVGVFIDGGRHKSKAALIVGLILNIGIIAVFKYADFLAETLNAVGVPVPKPGIALPIGISFFTFQSISYIIDVYRGQVRAQKDFFSLLLYISMFPQLIAGPIVRYSTISAEINRRSISMHDLAEGSFRFLVGLGKKVILANQLGELSAAFLDGDFASLSTGGAWIGILAYTMQIYFDFSGYSDMAIGMGRCMGFHFDENFNYPYVTRTITEFWRRWHMTLGRWFKKYLYFPLGGSRCSFAKTIRNTFVVWAFTGLWHGASWNFVLWGLIFFVLLTIERLGLGKLLAKTKVLKHIYVIFLIPLTWVVFALPNMQDIATYFSRLFPFFADNTASFVNTKDVIRALHDYWYLLIACVVFCLPFPSRWYEKHKNSKLVILGLVLIYLMSVYKMQTQTSNPFLYYQF